VPELLEGGAVKELVYHRLFLPAIERHAGAPCVHDGPYHATFAEHGERVLRLASAMSRELGLSREDRFALLSLNGHEMMELEQAGLLGAGIVVPLNIRLSPDDLAHILADSESSVLFVDARLAEVYDKAVVPRRGELPLRTVVLVGEADVPRDAAYEELLRAGEPEAPAEPEEEDAATLVYTGGTTGRPRGALRSQRSEALYVYHAVMAGGVACRRGWTYLHQAPMFHATAMVSVFSATAFGVTSVVLPGFEPAACLDAIEQYGVDETVLVPTMLQMLFAHPAFAPERLRTLRRIGYGAMPMPPALLERLLELLPGVELVQGFGMTEAGVLTMLGPDEHRGELLGSVGRAVPGVVLSIQDAEGRFLSPGEAGEVCARGGNLMREYWRDPEATAEAFRGGWYHTGDVGYLDEQGYLYLVDRLKDMIVTGGENVYSVEVEAALASHPAVAQVAVIGIPHEVWGEQVHAIVVPHPGASVSAEDIVAHARARLASYKVPKSVELRAEPLPMSAAMKPLKRELRRPYWEGRR
jgi:long-chain acyl-CoA synthetase